jgi:hypothetical protein
MNSDNPENETIYISQFSIQTFLFLTAICSFCVIVIYAIFKSDSPLILLLFPLVIIFALIFLFTGKITLTPEYIVTSLDNKIYFSDVKSLGIFPLYGSIPFVPGYTIAVWRNNNLRFMVLQFIGCAYADNLTKIFINTALMKNPSIQISKSLITEYGEPPYLIDSVLMEKITGKR